MPIFFRVARQWFNRTNKLDVATKFRLKYIFKHVVLQTNDTQNTIERTFFSSSIARTFVYLEVEKVIKSVHNNILKV